MNGPRSCASNSGRKGEDQPTGLLNPIMFTTRFHQPAPHYRGGMSRKATWQGCAMSNVAGTVRRFGRSTSSEASKCLLDSAAIAQLNPEAQP